jgi:hypothetical protein
MKKYDMQSVVKRGRSPRYYDRTARPGGYDKQGCQKLTKDQGMTVTPRLSWAMDCMPNEGRVLWGHVGRTVRQQKLCHPSL